MPLSVPATLAVSVILSALGAVVLCLLVALYGFTPASELSRRRAGRRQLATGIGHAVAASCFAATAILIATVLVQSPRPPAPVPRDDARVPALGAQLAGQQSRLTEQESRLAGQESRLTGHESRLVGQESRLTQAEARLEAINDTVRRAVAREERPAEPPARRASTPPQPARAPSARTVAPTERAPAPEVVVVRPAPAPRAAGVRPYDVEGSAFTTPPVSAPVGPLATTTLPASPATASALTPAPSASVPAAAPPASAPVVTPPARRLAAEPALAERPASPTPSRSGLLDKLREDWATIKRSFEAGEEDFRKAMEDTRRKLRGLVGE